MPSSHIRTARIALVALTLTVLCTGCGGFKPPVQPNAVDDSRLQALAAESVLDGGERTEAHSPDTSANVTVERGTVSLDDPWPVEVADDGSVAPGATLAAAREMLGSLRDAGWTPIAVGCELDRSGELGEAQVYATKRLGDFTAAVAARVSADSSQLAGYAPFHEEDADPWLPQAAVAAGTSCLDAATPPAEDVEPPDELNVDSRY